MSDRELHPLHVPTDHVPTIIGSAGTKACWRFLEFFTAEIRNAGTRQVYARAASRFFSWCERRGLKLMNITPFVVGTYIECLGTQASRPTVKIHLAALRKMFDYLVTGQVIPINPAASVRGPKHVVKKGKTPVLSAQETRQLLDAINLSSIAGLRDRALIGVMVYSFARISAVVGMNVEDYYAQGRRMWFRFQEKGGTHHQVPAHHKAEEYMDEYLVSAGIEGEGKAPLFRTLARSRWLTSRRMHRVDALRMIKRRARVAGLPSNICCHTFRATGITVYLQGGGQLEHAQKIASHASSRTTKLYDRTSDEVGLEEIEKIVI